MRWHFIVVFVLVISAGCLSNQQTRMETETHLVHVYNDTGFEPQNITIERGDKIVWVVHNGTHRIASNDDSWSSGELTEGDRYSHVFAQTGTYQYHCHYHSHKANAGDGKIKVVEGS